VSVELEFQKPWVTKFLIPICKFFGYLLFLILGPIRATGKYRVPKSGGLLILANHLADIDPVIVQFACPREIYFMAKSELFEMKGLGKAIRWFCAFPVKRGEPDRDAIKMAVAYLQAGKAVCVFPEGQLSEDGDLQELKAGVALIARMADCHVICCKLQNTNKVMPYGNVIPRPSFQMIHADWGECHKFEKHVKAEEFLAWVASELS
jgi:1-acyl-sn-glycerol-3-phosphate acyltransferase